MARVVAVGVLDDPRLVEVAGLTDAAARAATEAEHGCFVVEGLLALEAAVASPYPLRLVLVAEPKLERVLPIVDTTDVDVLVAPRQLLETVTGFNIHRGVVASASRLPLPAPTALFEDAGVVLLVEGVNDHENLGALFRNAAAFGVDAVLLDDSTADPLYRRSVRVSAGHVLRVPWTRGVLLDEVAHLHELGFTTAALTPTGEVDIHELAPAERRAWLIGAEGPGLTEAAMGVAHQRVRVPVADGVDSLNVATAAAVALALTAPTARAR